MQNVLPIPQINDADDGLRFVYVHQTLPLGTLHGRFQRASFEGVSFSVPSCFLPNALSSALAVQLLETMFSPAHMKPVNVGHALTFSHVFADVQSHPLILRFPVPGSFLGT